MEKEKKSNRRTFGIGAIIVIVIIVVLICSGNSEDYKSCVHSCVHELDSCGYLITDYGSQYCTLDDYQSCFDDLDMCISDCEY